MGSKRYARRQDGRELQGRQLLACCLEEMGLGREKWTGHAEAFGE
jgi:hypothetical protein